MMAQSNLATWRQRAPFMAWRWPRLPSRSTARRRTRQPDMCKFDMSWLVSRESP